MNAITETAIPVFGCTRHFLNPDDSIAEYRGNPLIGALGPIADENARAEVLLQLPDYDESLCFLAPHLRSHAIRSMSGLFVPMPEHDRVMQEMDIMLRRGLIHRNPLSIKYRRQMQKDRLLLLSGSLPPERYAGMPLLGGALLDPPGCGKTTLCGLITSHYPQVVHHGYEIDGTRFAFTQVVYLTINLFQDASLKAFAIEFFEKLGAALQRPELRSEWKVDGCNGNTAQPLIYSAAREYNLGLLVIDDSQNMVANNKGYAAVLNYFVRMMNCLGLPTVLIGTHRMAELLAADTTFGRRFTGNIPRMKQMRPAVSGKGLGRWENFLEHVWRYRFVRTPSDCQRLSGLVYELTGGIPDLVVKLYTLAQTRCFGRVREEITEDVLKETAAELFSLVGDRILELKGQREDGAGVEHVKRKLDVSFKELVNDNLTRIGANPAFETSNPTVDVSSGPRPAPSAAIVPEESVVGLRKGGRPLIAAGKAPNIKAALASAGMLEKIR